MLVSGVLLIERLLDLMFTAQDVDAHWMQRLSVYLASVL
jgi:hypothetical protein